MWTGNKIYFISDRDENKRFNLYGYDIDSKQTRKFTSFVDFDIKFPSLGNDAIVFENGGYIYRFDLKSRKAEKIPIFVADDQVDRPRRVDGCQQADHQLRNFLRREPRAVRRSRRDFHRSGKYRKHAEPDQYLRRS